MRRTYRVRRHISSKPHTCTEDTDVYAAGISVKVARITLGDLPVCLGLLSSRGDRMNRQKSADGIVGFLDQAEGSNLNCVTGA
jgi:hypothetical protein